MRIPEPASPTFTIFTPTRDRGAVLHRVRDSLLRQTYRDFEWIIVDNASTDGTDELVADWIAEGSLPIRYLRNAEDLGFHGSWRRAVDDARGELFLFVRSADEIVPEALERFLWHWRSIPDAERARFSAVTALAVDEHGTLNGSRFPRDVLDSDSIEIRYRYKVRGEKFGFQRTDVLRATRIPDPPGFRGAVPASVTWKTIARRYRTRYVNEVLRVYWQDQAVSLSHPAVAWTDAPGRLLDAESTIDHDVRWILHAPIPIFRDAVAYVTSSLHTGRGLAAQWRRLRGIGPRALWAAAVPVGVVFYALQRYLSPIARRLPSP